MFVLIPSLKTEFLNIPTSIATTRPDEPHARGMTATFFSMLVLAVLYALTYQGGSGLIEGARFGA